MLLGQTVSQERIMNRARERYVHDSSRVNMSDFGAAQAEFPAAKTVRVSCNIRPYRNFCFQLLPISHVKRHPQSAFWMTGFRRAILSCVPERDRAAKPVR